MAFNAKLTLGGDAVEYRVRKEGGCVLIFGEVSLGDFALLMKLAPEKSIIDPDLARMAGANFAFGLPIPCRSLRKRYAGSAVARERAEHPWLSDAAVNWLAHGERGVSSNTMFHVLGGVRILDEDDFDHPYDPDDLRRCRLLLEQCPEFAVKFERMREVSDTWARLVAQWDALCATMDEECPQWREGEGRAPKTFAMVRDIVFGGAA